MLQLSKLIRCKNAMQVFRRFPYFIHYSTRYCVTFYTMFITDWNIFHAVAFACRVGHHNHKFFNMIVCQCGVVAFYLLLQILFPEGHSIVLAEIAHNTNYCI